jgi:hypothetical protein
LTFQYIRDKKQLPKKEVAIDVESGLLAPTGSETALFMFSIGSHKYSEEVAIKNYKTRLFNMYKAGELVDLVQTIKDKDEVYLITSSSSPTEFSKVIESFLTYLSKLATV